MIPRTLHTIWLGSSLPARFEHFLQGFRLLNPDWGVTIWDEDRLRCLAMQNAAEFQKEGMPLAFRSDVARLEILATHGGLYADADVEWKRRLDGGFIPREDVAWFSREDDWTINNGVIAAAPGHPAILDMIKVLPARVSRLWHPMAFLPVVSGPGLVAEALSGRTLEDVAVWPFEVVCRSGRIARAPYCFHHYAGSHSWGRGIPG